MKIAIGRYVNDNTFFHRMDPRVKFIGNILFLVLFFIVKDFMTYALLIIPLIVAFLISTKSFRALFKISRLPLYIGIFIFLINMWILRPTTLVYGSWWEFTFSYQSIVQTLSVVLRIYALIMATTILTFTTKPVLLTIAIEDILWPLKLIRFPVQRISMIISITLRFVPTLIDESSRIMKAQASRGVDFKNGNIKSKTKSTITLIIPLFVSAFIKADDLANAMETRGYDTYAKRTRYRKLSFTWRDLIVVAIFALFITLVVFDINFFNSLPDWWQASKIF